MVDSTTNSVMRLSNILEIRLPVVNALEKRIYQILQRNNTEHDDDEDENDDIDFIEKKMDRIIEEQYELFKTMDRSKRIAFWDELQSQLHRLPERCLSECVRHQMSLLEMICQFDFTERSLSFAFEGIHNLDILTECEQQLLGLLEKLRNEYNVTDLLTTQYQSVRNQRRKVVLAVAGGLKAGKSSFINYLLGLDVCPVGISETTARLTKITYGQQNLVTLESSTGGQPKERYKIDNSEQFKEVTERLIALKGAAREENLCKDIVTIYLDRQELENIELWDIPGFDENPFLNSIVEDILKQTNIFFILASITEAVRDTMVNLVRSCSDKQERPPQLCFIATKIDQVTTNPTTEKSLNNSLDDLFRRIQDRYKLKNFGDNWQSSSFFIPLCTNRKFNLKDFLDCHQQFTRKLKDFFTTAVCWNTIVRLEYLIDAMHELLDYDNLDRNIQRDEKLNNLLTNHLNELCTRLDGELKRPLLQIHQRVASRVSIRTQSESDETMRDLIAVEIQKELLGKEGDINARLMKCLDECYSKMKQHPALTALMHSMEQRKLYGDPYKVIVGQCCNEEHRLLHSAKNYHLSSLRRKFVNWIGTTIDFVRQNPWPNGSATLHALTSAVIDLSITSVIETIEESHLLRKRAQGNALLIVDDIVDGVMKEITINISQKFCEQLNTLSEDITRRKAKLIEKKGTAEARLIAKFLKDNNSSIVQLYLNLLDKANRLEYPHYKIDCTNELGHSNFPVFAGELGDTDATQIERIAVKRVPLSSFTWQEVRYMNELKHENILRYYGVRESDDHEEHYDILMQRLDSDLTKYIDYAVEKGKINDQFLDNIFTQIANGLEYLHKQGLMHRDIKPENILVQLRQNQPPIFVLADFGFVHRVPISIKGTPGFLAPELLVNNTENTFITAKIDMYALGVTIQQTIDNSKADKQVKYASFWAEVSRRCQSKEPFQRPTCQEILHERKTLWE